MGQIMLGSLQLSRAIFSRIPPIPAMLQVARHVPAASSLSGELCAERRHKCSIGLCDAAADAGGIGAAEGPYWSYASEQRRIAIRRSTGSHLCLRARARECAELRQRSMGRRHPVPHDRLGCPAQGIFGRDSEHCDEPALWCRGFPRRSLSPQSGRRRRMLQFFLVLSVHNRESAARPVRDGLRHAPSTGWAVPALRSRVWGARRPN